MPPRPRQLDLIRLELLSFDVQLTILSFLDPLDILSLRKTCKTLQQTTLQRIVWINALRRVCIRNSIFMPTFPLQDMSQAALEYAATGPERFLRAVADYDLPQPRSHHIIQRDQKEFVEIFLVPGGRYMVTIDSTMVAVWDLGIPGLSSTTAQNTTTEPISTLPIHENFWCAILLVHSTDDGRGLTIFTNYEFDEIVRFIIFRIYPSEELPSLQQIAQIDIPSSHAVSFCSLSRNRVIYLHGSTLNVWDFVEDAWASIQVPDHYEQIIVSESAILLPYPDLILIWKMPPLSKSTPLFSGPPSNIPPSFTLKIPNTWQLAGTCRGPCDWYSGSSQPLLFDLSSGFEFRRFEIVHENENFSDSVVKTLGTYDDLCNDFESCRFCNDTLVCWWVGDGDPKAHIASLPSATHDPIEANIHLFKWLDKGAMRYYPSSLCPFSGRFACVDRSNGVKVMDYFSYSLPMPSFPKPPNWLRWSSLPHDR